MGFAGLMAHSLSSHPLKPRLEAAGKLDNFNLAANQLLFHAVALLAVAALSYLWPKAAFQWSGYLLLVGSVFFQGTVLIKSFAEMGSLGLLTPIGGLLLMLGWLSLIVGAFRI